MTPDGTARLFLDNSTVAGAGRALYDERPDPSDCISLAHLVTAALLCDEILIDGSSRFIPVKAFVLTGGQKVSKPTAAIWTWEKRYPALAELCPIVDGFWQRQLGFDQDKVVEYLLKALAGPTPSPLQGLDVSLVPPIYLSSDYFDLGWLTEAKREFEKKAGTQIDDHSFKILLYAWRGIYYHEVSKRAGATYFPNPQRDHFIEPLLVAGKSIFLYDSPAIKLLAKVVAEPRYKVIQQVAKEKEKEYAFPLPPFLSYVLRECDGKRSDIVAAVKRLRKTKGVQATRRLISEYDVAYRADDLLKLLNVKKEIEASMRNFERRYSIEPAAFTIAPKLPLVMDVKGFDLSVRIPPILFTELFQKPFLSLTWGVADALLKNGFGLDRIQELAPVPREPGNHMEWVLMERSSMIAFEGDQQSTDLTVEEAYLEGNVAGPQDYYRYGYQSASDMRGDTARPALPPGKNTVVKPKGKKGKGKKKRR